MNTYESIKIGMFPQPIFVIHGPIEIRDSSAYILGIFYTQLRALSFWLLMTDRQKFTYYNSNNILSLSVTRICELDLKEISCFLHPNYGP
jgi:hypothetical protein